MKSPNWTGDPILAHAQISVANSNRDGATGTYVHLYTGPKGGARVNGVVIVPVGSTTAGMIRFFLKPPAGSLRLRYEVEVAANVPSGTMPVTAIEVEFPRGLNVPETWELHASTEQGETFNLFVDGGVYASVTDTIVNPNP